MHIAFADVVEGLRDIARWERQRIELMQFHAVRGRIEPAPDVAFAGWRERLARIEAAGKILTILVPHEIAVRALDPRLNVPLTSRPPIDPSWPS